MPTSQIAQIKKSFEMKKKKKQNKIHGFRLYKVHLWFDTINTDKT